MKKNLTYLLFCFLVISKIYLSAQETNVPATRKNIPNRTIDSLLNVLNTSNSSSPELNSDFKGESSGLKADTTKIKTLNGLSFQYYKINNYEKSLQYALLALEKAEKLILINKEGKWNFAIKKEIAIAHDNCGSIYYAQAYYQKALDHFLQSLKIKKEVKDKRGMALTYNNIGDAYWYLGNYEKCLENYLKALIINDETADKKGMANSYFNIGYVYLNQNNYEKAFDNFSKELKICEEIGDLEGEANALKGIGDFYEMMRDYPKALENYLKCLKINIKLKNRNEIARAYGNIGNAYLYEEDYPRALENYLKYLKFEEEFGSKRQMAEAYSSIGKLYLKLNKFQETDYYLNKSLIMSKEIGYKDLVKQVYSFLSDLYEKKGDYKQAFEYQELFSEMKDTLLNEQSGKQIAEMNTRYDSERKDKEIELLNKEKESRASLETAEKRKQQVILFSISGFSLLLMVFAILTYYSFRQKQRLNKELKKLSIVASETDNGVLICGPHGELEWTNAGFTRLSGYSLEEFKEVGKTLEEVSANPEIKFVIHQSIENKKSAVYQSLNTTKDGTAVWTQSTLTPILDEKGNIKKLLVIDTDISERKKIEEKLNEQNAELEKSHKNISSLSEIGKEITTSLSFEKIIEKTHENINKLIRADVFCIGIHNKLSNTIDFSGFIEKTGKYNSSYDMNDDTLFPVLCFKKRREILINDLQNEFKKPIRNVSSQVTVESSQSIIYLPLFSKEKTIGVITVESFQKNAYTSYHIDILKNLAVYVAIAIENAQLYENLEEKVKERTIELLKKNEEIEKTFNNIQVLSEIGQEITSTLDFNTVLETVYEKVNSLMDATEFGIGIYHHEQQFIDLSYYIYESKRIGNIDIGVHVSMYDKNRLSVWCTENRKAVFINDMQSEYSKYISNLDAYKGEGKLLLESVICLPLIIEEKLVGLISVQSPRKNAYTQNDLEILQTLASYIAIAIDNASLYDNMEAEVKARTVEIEKQKELVEEKNLKIIDSITYARLIQQSILMEESEIQQFLPDSFIYYQPKDIVSGDFYWYSKIDDTMILAAIDCTGHGVPGAFMSMIGNTLLNQIVNEKRNTKPSEILQLLNLGIYEALHQQKGGVLSHDGMDIALCSFDYKNGEFQYAGAQNPLYIVWENSIDVIKADMHTIGGGGSITTGFDPLKRTYTNHIIPIKKGMSVYLFSDGYMDQFGDQNRKKFGIQQFKDLVLNNQHLNMRQQKEKIVSAFEDWKGATPQIDDVLVIGLKL